MDSRHENHTPIVFYDRPLYDPSDMISRLCIFLVMFVLFSSATFSLVAEEQRSTPAAIFGSWEIRCVSAVDDTQPRTCAAVLEFIQSDSQQRFLAWSIVKQPTGTFATQVLTPVGVVIAPGVQISIAGGAQVYRLLFQSCGQGGCSAGGEMPNDMLTSLLSADKATIVFTSTAGNDIRVDFSLFDIKGALAAL